MAVATLPPSDIGPPAFHAEPQLGWRNGETSSKPTLDKDSSPPVSPSHAGSGFNVPFPYSVSLPYMQGGNSNLSTYFAASGPNQPLPDDSDVQTRLPSICVDYLSHDWKEDDIWTSWKAMTKHKADLANGVRLENASWRTWAKQRNKLRTISPETLNWLKDSDVTWLYGPLHTAVDPVPPAKAATMEDRLNLDPQTQARHAANPIKSSHHDVRAKTHKAAATTSRNLAPTKPILKYRSLSDILSVPTHRHLVDYAYDESDETSENRTEDGESARPPLPHTRSDTVIHRSTRRTPTPVSVKGEPLDATAANGPTTPSDRSASADELEPPRKHISFNHFVEQCIAVDSDDDPSLYESASSATSDDEEDDEDDALSFRSSPRGGTFALLKTQPLHFDREKEPHTIAKLAPTVLKSSDMVYPSPSPAVVFNGQVIGSNVGANGTVHWDSSDHAAPVHTSAGAPTSKWDDDEEYGAAGYDFFEGNADFGVGDEYTGSGAQQSGSRKGSSRTPTDQSPASSSGPSSPNLQAATEGSRSMGRSILKSRVPGPYSGDTSGQETPTLSPPVPASPVQPSYAEVAKAGASQQQPQQPVLQVQRGRSISRGSSSSSLDRSASQDGRRASPQVVPGEPERGRSFRRNNSSGSSLNNLGTSPSSTASDATLHARAKREAELEPPASAPPTSLSSPADSAVPSSSSSSASLSGSRDQASTSDLRIDEDKPPDRGRDVIAYDFAQDEEPDFDRHPHFLFDSPHMPSSPTSSSVGLPRNNSFSTALQSVRWSDDEPSAARRALLRAQSRDCAASGVGRRPPHELVDDYGLNFAGFSDDEETGGIVGRAVEIVGTARDLVGALWTVAFRRSCVLLVPLNKEAHFSSRHSERLQASASMAIAPIQGMIRRRFIRDLSISLGVGFFFANVWWYGYVKPKIAHREAFYEKYRQSHPEIFS